MKRMKALDFETVKLPGPAKLSCRFITNSDDSITFFGDSVEEIFDQCQQKFPNGLKTRGIIFSGSNSFDAKKNLSAFLSLGFRAGYFKSFSSEENENNS